MNRGIPIFADSFYCRLAATFLTQSFTAKASRKENDRTGSLENRVGRCRYPLYGECFSVEHSFLGRANRESAYDGHDLHVGNWHDV